MITYADGFATLHHGDCRDVLRERPAGSVHVAVTSPPYFGLRDYGLPPSVWGGDPSHEHTWGAEERGKRKDILPPELSTSEARMGTSDRQGLGPLSGGRFCTGCSAWLGLLGLEPTIDLYVRHLVEIFREVRRVLRDDGTFWLNIGDSWNGSGGAGGDYEEGGTREGQPRYPGRHLEELKPKDLCGIPWELAFALRKDGWWLRSDIVWTKRNPAPESVSDRPTKAHEYVFLLAKSGDTQFWTHRDLPGTRQQPKPDYRWSNGDEERDTAPEGWTPKNREWIRRNLWHGHDYFYDDFAVREKSVEGGRTFKGGSTVRPGVDVKGGHQGNGWKDYQVAPTKNRRSVWEINTEPYAGEHYASFPRALVEPCILAGSSARGVCSVCGAPQARIVEVEKVDKTPSGWDTGLGAHGAEPPKGRYPQRIDYEGKNIDTPEHASGRRLLSAVRTARAQGGDHDNPFPPKETVGWQPTCEHFDAEVVPATVLDTFAGSGTSLLVAKALGRRSIGCELSDAYCKLAAKRIGGVTLPMGVGV